MLVELTWLGTRLDDLIKAGISKDDILKAATNTDKFDDIIEYFEELAKSSGRISNRDKLLNAVKHPKLRDAVSEHRPGAVIGDGGTADALRFEKETGKLISKSGHLQKANEMSKHLQRIIDSGVLSGSDLKIATDMLSDLLNAIGGK